MESKAMNIFDSLIPTTNGTASMKGASLSLEPENLEFASLMGQSMQVQEGELTNALPIVAEMKNKDLPASNVSLNKISPMIADTELLLLSGKNKEMSLVNLNQEENSEIVENILRLKPVNKKHAITINVNDSNNDSLKLSSPKGVVNRSQSELLPGLSDIDFQKDPHRQLTAHLKNLNAKEVLINDKLQPEKTGTESVFSLLGSEQMESFVRSNIKRAGVENRGTFSIVNQSQQVSGETASPIGDMMKKQNELVIEKEANAQKVLEQKSESLFKIGNVDSLGNDAGNSGKTNLSNMQTITQLKTSTDGHITETVKIILPENFKLSTSQKTQTIMIRIEPDHLGPARLELTMTNDLLSAKLIVETVEAKSILENSISQLKEKLASADIKVENLEINVRSESHNSQMSDKQQAHWQNQKTFRQFNRLDESLTSNEPAAMEARTNLSPQYAGAGGVNLLA